jgi:hypothetical protein
MPLIKSISDFRAAIRQGNHAWPGGYPLFFICDDGGALCPKCAKTERRNIVEAIAYNLAGGWRVSGIDINWEDTTLFCDHCNEKIESAYGDD